MPPKSISKLTLTERLQLDLKNNEAALQMLVQLLETAKTKEQKDFLKQRIRSKTQEIEAFKKISQLP